MIARRSPTPVKLESRQVTTVAKVRRPGSRIAGARVGLRHAACRRGRGVERVREVSGGAERGRGEGAKVVHWGLRRGCSGMEGLRRGCGPQ
jgi:hypothetical protein